MLGQTFAYLRVSKLDQDLESELGIDSIKRMEILQAFQNALPPRLVTQLSHEMDVLSRSKTLDGLVNKFMEAMGRLDGKKADLSAEKKKPCLSRRLS